MNMLRFVTTYRFENRVRKSSKYTRNYSAGRFSDRKALSGESIELNLSLDGKGKNTNPSAGEEDRCGPVKGNGPK